ncbi:hypothetical protein [Mumia sp. DW29H23]|uniref:hypothetical protein n=1 Tax=Mumia sp. DW29H23 TaxID=3421241 RepID=UPI003D69E29B
MAQVQAVVNQPPAAAVEALRMAAARQGWAYDLARSEPWLEAFRKGASAFSWGATMTVQVVPGASPTETVFRFTTSESFAITDWGRGRRAVQRLVQSLGGRVLP